MTVHCIRAVHKGKGCQSAISCWCRVEDTSNGAGSAMRTDGTIYPRMIEKGRILRSVGLTTRTLLANFPGNELAVGDVRRCIRRYIGMVTAKVIFWRINPKITML